jgi:4-hydroxyacetophenone monooxygenase
VTQNEDGTESTQLNRLDTSGIAGDRQQIIADALKVADLNALRVTLYQLTGDHELRDMPLETIAIRNGRVFQKVVHRDYQGRLKEIAAGYLGRELGDTPPRPDEARTLELLNMAEGREIPQHVLRLAKENLALDDKPAPLSVGLNPGVRIPDDFHVTIVGGGHTGVAMAIYLQQLGIPFTIIEAHPSFGGTWVINHYPNLRVDVPGDVYQYRFVDYRWPNYFPSQKEIMKYADHVAELYDLKKNTRLSTSVEGAEWDPKAMRWNVRLSDGTTHSSNFIVNALGLFANASIPNIPGLQKFKGPKPHTASWDDDFDPTGKTVALIGNGSSGTQLMPWLADKAKKLYAFQRTAQWIVPPLVPVDTKISPALHWLMDNLPDYRKWHNYVMQLPALNVQDGHEVDHEWLAQHGTLSEHNAAFRENLLAYIEEQLEGRTDLILKSIPTMPPLARRLIVDAGWYKNLKRPHVELVTDSIAEIDETGIKMVNGTHYDLDAIVLGSGFDIGKFFFPVHYVGEGGMTFAAAWEKDGARSYVGMSYPDFPNFFSTYGAPNSHPRSGGFHIWTEAWARYVASLILITLNQGAKSLKVRHDAFERYNEDLDKQFDKLIWNHVGDHDGGYYINPQHHRPTVHMPYRSEVYYEMLATPKTEDYIFE